jgi:hypothetical protein
MAIVMNTVQITSMSDVKLKFEFEGKEHDFSGGTFVAVFENMFSLEGVDASDTGEIIKRIMRGDFFKGFGFVTGPTTVAIVG